MKVLLLLIVNIVVSAIVTMLITGTTFNEVISNVKTLKAFKA
jgi:hypothetical protein